MRSYRWGMVMGRGTLLGAEARVVYTVFAALVVTTERLELLDGRGVVVAIVDRRIGRAISIGERRVATRGVFARFLFLALGVRRRRIVVGRGPGVHGCRDHRHR